MYLNNLFNLIANYNFKKIKIYEKGKKYFGRKYADGIK